MIQGPTISALATWRTKTTSCLALQDLGIIRVAPIHCIEDSARAEFEGAATA